MNVSLTLTEADLKQAIAEWLGKKGYNASRASFHINKIQGDRPWESDYTTITVSGVEAP